MKRFSQIYLFGGQAIDDSQRFRVRLSSLYFEVICDKNPHLENQIFRLVHSELGVEIRLHSKFPSVLKLIRDGEMRDVLDLISLVSGVLKANRVPTRFEIAWGSSVSRYFKEENLAYRLDEECVVHRFIDEEFDRATVSTLTVLVDVGLVQAARALQLGLSKLTGTHQDTKGAVTATFEACEIVARTLVPEAKNLHNKLCQNQLRVVCASPTATQTETKVETGIFSAMAEWVDAVHFYRHGAPEASTVAPSEELAVQLISMGCAFIRRLAQAYLKTSKISGHNP